MIQTILLIQLKDFNLNSQNLWRNKIFEKKKLKSTLSGININVSYLLQKKNKTETGSTSMDVLFIIKPTAIKSWHDQVDFWNIQQL